jgi:tetratricopeptide (TPR) repeat protein
MARERRSLQDLIQGRQQSGFAGRQEQLAQYQANLALPVEDEHRRFLFNIHGVAGAGKTYLAKQLRQAATAQGALTAYTDEAADDLTAVMTGIAAELDPDGAWRRDFEQRAAASRGRPGPGPAPAGAYLARKFGDHTDVRLLPPAAEELTPAFVTGLNRVAAGRPLALFFDTYERTSGLLDRWLRDLYRGRYGALPATLVITIAGRSPLDPKLWGQFLAVIADVPLGPFSEAAARQFLASQGISNDGARRVILTRAQGLPVWLAALGAALPLDAGRPDDQDGDPAGQMLGWQSDPARRSAAVVAALPRLFDEDVLAVIAPSGETAGELLSWLRGLEFVTRRAGSWAYHEVVRSAMLLRERTQAQSEWRAKHSALARAHARWAEDTADNSDKEWANAGWIDHTRESIYHLLCANPINNLHQALASAVKAGEHSPARAHQWAWLFTDAGRDIDHPVLREWGQRLLDGINENDLTEYLSCLIADAQLPEPTLVAALTARGEGYRRADRGDEALADFSRAIDLDPEHVGAIASRGETHRDAERHDEALDDFSRAIDLDPGPVRALISRAETYRLTRQCDQALDDFSRAIELDPRSPGATIGRGETYYLMERYDEALDDFSRAIEISPGWAWAIIDRGETYRVMARYDDALADLNRAIQLDPSSVWALINRAETFHLVKQYDDALADLNRTLELTPGSSSVIALRGEIYGLMERYDDALADFSRAIDLDPSYAWAIACRGETYQQMERYDNALADVGRAIELEPDSSSAVALRGEIYRETGRYDEALTDLNRAIELDPGYAWAIGSRGQTHRETGRYDEALADLNRAIELDPGYAWAIGSRGQTYREMGRHREAHADLTRAIELDPSLAGTFGAFLAGPATGKPGPPAGTASPAAETTNPPTSDSRRD